MKVCSRQNHLRIFNNKESACNRMFKYMFAYMQAYILMMASIDIHCGPEVP